MPLGAHVPILVVDHFPEATQTIGRVLNRLGYDAIASADSGGAALHLLKHHAIGLIIADWRLQPVCGRRLLDHVRANPATASLPFIVMSTDFDQATQTEAKRAGATAVLPKPFESRELAAIIMAIDAA